MNTSSPIRTFVEQAIYLQQITPDIEAKINHELTSLGYISDDDYEALELLMSEMDAGRIKMTTSRPDFITRLKK